VRRRRESQPIIPAEVVRTSDEEWLEAHGYDLFGLWLGEYDDMLEDGIPPMLRHNKVVSSTSPVPQSISGRDGRAKS